MDRIGILTFHRTTNFGSLLQTYALYQKVVDLGCDCRVIDYRCPAIEERENLKLKLLPLNIKLIIRQLLFWPLYKKKAAVLDDFARAHLTLTKAYTPASIRCINDEIDRFIVGSDIVWGRDITKNDYAYFLDFVADDKPKYAFASSVGDYGIRGDETKIGKLLNRFNRIAVREQDAIEWLYNLGIDSADWVCDPTMLLTRDEWVNNIVPKKYHKKYVLVYFLDDKRKNLSDALDYAKLHSCDVYLINYDRPLQHVHNISPKTIEEFLGLIMHAEMIFTASYHGMLFSLYFMKEMLFYTRAHKSRVLSLARRLGIEDYCGDNNSIQEYQSINYEIVNMRIEIFRKESINVLAKMLGS